MAVQREASPVDQFLSSFKTADGVFVVGNRQRITHWTPMAEQILEQDASAVMNQVCQDIIGGKDARNSLFCRHNCPIINNARKGRPTKDYDILVESGSGEAKWLNVSVLVVPGKPRQAPSIVHIFRDVTRRRNLEEHTRTTVTSLRDFVADAKRRPTRPGEPGATPATRLTRRELEVLRMIITGLTTEQIAEHLGISPITARNHTTNLQTKLGAKNRLQAVLAASQLQLV